MQAGRLRAALTGLFLSAFYCVTFLAAWRCSVDQWYLPAGVRAAALFLLPYRYWPYVFAGDAAALLMLRGPKADQYSLQWALLSPFLLAPLVSIVPAAFRRYLGDLRERDLWFPLIGLAFVTWTTVCSMTLNDVLSGPVADNSAAKFLRFIVGDYLAVFLIVPPVMVWLRRRDGRSNPAHLAWHALFGIGMTAVFYIAIDGPLLEPALEQLLMVLMITPAVALTFVHGWRGAAIGVSVAILAIGATLLKFDAVGAHDATAFVAQLVLAIAAMALLVLGSLLSEHFDKVRKLGISEQHALKIAQASFLSSERRLRDRVLAMAQIQAYVDDTRQDLIQWLKRNGQHGAAMELTRNGVLHTQLFDEHASALYPMRIEQHGLFDALQSRVFSTLWASGTPVRYKLKGHVKALTVDLQLAAFRCACSTLIMLWSLNPTRHTIKARVWTCRGRRGIVIAVTAGHTHETEPSPMSVQAELELEGRIKAHGGIFRRRHVNQISFFLAEPAGQLTGYVPGLMSHVLPSAA